MKAVIETIDGFEFMIEAVEELDVLGSDSGMRKTHSTSLDKKIQGAYSKLKKLITVVAKDLGEQIDSISDEVRPSEMAMEISLGFSAETNLWVVAGSTDSSFKLTMSWKLDN